MYIPHSRIETPPRDAVLWRYMKFEEYVSVLDQRALFFSKVCAFNDTFEGSLTKSVHSWINTLGEPEIFRKALREYRDRILVNCWHKSTYESKAMWELYGDSIAIRTTCGRLCQSLIDNQPVHVASVLYADYNEIELPMTTPEQPMRNFYDFHLLKRRGFEHEREVRVISTPYNPAIEGGGTYYKVNLNSLIEKVFVAPNSKDWFLDLVRSVSKKYDVKAPVCQSSLKDTPLF